MNTINLGDKTVNRRLLYAVHSIFEQGAKRANNRIGDTPFEKEERVVRKDGGYKCIHLSPDQFCVMLGEVLQHRGFKDDDSWLSRSKRLKFLDVGCGVGEKVYLASLFGLNSFGLELRKELVDEGVELFKSMGHGIIHWSENPVTDCFIHADALTYDYSNFDILYFYCPLVDHTLQKKLELQIANTAKKGAIVIPASPWGFFSYYDGNWPKDMPADWKSVLTGDNNTSKVRYFIREA